MRLGCCLLNLLLVVFLLCISLFSKELFGQDLNEGLILHYEFNGNADDSSSNEFHGISNADLAENRFGELNKAFYFNGVDHYVDFPNEPLLKPQLPISIAAWVKFDNNVVNNSYFINTDFAYNSHSGVWFNLTSTGKLAIGYGDNTNNTSPSNRRTKLSTSSIQPDVWYHILGVIRGPTDMDIYINCENDGGTYQGTGGEIGYTDNPGTIGKMYTSYNGPLFHFKGTIDDVRIWNRSIDDNIFTCNCEENLALLISESDLDCDGDGIIAYFDYDDNDDTIGTEPPEDLAVELIEFSGNSIIDGIQLNWTTASEIESDYFSIMHAGDGSNFKEVGRVDAAGHSVNRLKYEFIHLLPSQGKNYYKLVETDQNGKEQSSNSIVIEKNENPVYFNVMPNPVLSEVLITFNSSDQLMSDVMITDISGKQILEIADINIKQGNNLIRIDMSAFTEGVYFIHFANPAVNGLYKVVKL